MNYPQIKPTLNLDFSNTKTLDPRINFRRGTPGAYYDGKTYAKAEENLIEHSEDFSQWGFGRIVQTSAQSAPDGSSGAYKIEQESGQTSSGYLLQTYTTSANKSYTFSVYAKAGTNRNYVVLRTYLSNNRFTYFDLVNGEAVNVDDHHVATIQDAGNGWYRCSITYTPVTSSNVQFNIYFSDNDSSITVADDGGFIYIWGAQLEQRDTVTAYTPTNGTPVTKYQPQLMFASPDQPRFDYDPLTGESKGLLIEEQRTNLFSYSEDLSGFYANGDIIVNKEKTVAPDGSFCGSIIRYDEPDSNIRPGQHIYLIDNISSSQNVSTSFYAKTINQANVVVNTGSCVVLFDLDLSQHTVLQNDNDTAFISASIEHVGNDWFRCTVIALGSGSNSQYQISPWLSSTEKNWGKRYHNGDSRSGVFLWGLQLELGSFPTSHIKTSGASVTRSADNASITGENFSSWYRQDEGSLYCEASKRDVPSSVVPVSVDAGASDYIFLNLRSLESFEIKKNNNYQVSALGFSNVSAETYHKIIGAYKKDSAAVSINGLSALNDSACEIPTVNRLTIGSTSGVTQNVHIKKLAYYPQRLTNEQLQQLTK